MKISDLKNIKNRYNEFRTLLFNNDIPDADHVDFILHSIKYAVGYSTYRDKPNKSGNHHVIAFSKYFEYDEDWVVETLIHEMIHLWQVYHVKEDRYKICSNDIAHDRVFTSKMNTINLLLEKNFYNYKITQVCKEDLPLDPNQNSKKDFYIIFLINKDPYKHNNMIKVREKNLEKLKTKYIELCKEQHFWDKIGILKTNSYFFNMLPYSTKLQNSFITTDINGKNMLDVFEDEIEIVYDSNEK